MGPRWISSSSKATTDRSLADGPGRSRIRRSLRGDLPELGRIEVAAAARFRAVAGLGWIADAPPTPPGAFDSHHAAGTLWIAAGPDDRPVGFLAAADLGGAFHVVELAVLPEHGRRGSGRELIAAAIGHARWTFCPAVTLTTYRDVPWNAPFYGQLGFVALRPDALSAELAAQLAGETLRGHAPARRVAMCKLL